MREKLTYWCMKQSYSKCICLKAGHTSVPISYASKHVLRKLNILVHLFGKYNYNIFIMYVIADKCMLPIT